MPLFDKLKSKVDGYLNQAQSSFSGSGGQQQPQSYDRPPPPPPEQSGTRLKWPPELVRPADTLGEVRDINGRDIPRDIGRSVTLGGQHYFLFGDTFCKDDQGNWLECANNTLALVPDVNDPTKSQYLQDHPQVECFVPHREDEERYTKDPENKKESKRIVNWVFSGIVETQEGSGEGWCFYDKIETHGAIGAKGFGLGVAKVRRDPGSNRVHVERCNGGEMTFGEEEPRFGSITAFAHPTDGYVYCLGSYGSKWENYMARVARHVDLSQRSNYEFLGKGFNWVKDYDRSSEGAVQGSLEPLLGLMAQGAIVYAPDHGPEGKPFLWFGVNKFMASVCYIGAAEKPEGPYDVHDVGELPKIMGDKSDHRYCLYPHLWASDLAKGMVTLSWSDDGQFGGKVAMGRFYFKQM